MGRKIPSRKHRGVRDPEQQRIDRLAKAKINEAPSNIDDQPVPKSLLRIADLMKKGKQSKSMKTKKTLAPIKKVVKKKKLVVVHTKVSKGEKPIPKFEQRKGESDGAFLHRVNQICEEVKRETAFEKKYGVEVKRNEETGKVEGLVKGSKDPVALMMKAVRKEKKAKKNKKKKKEPNGESLTKSQKRQAKLKEKKEMKIANKVDDFAKVSKDQVKFGEVVHAPPTLTAPRRIKKINEAPRPGKKELLLKGIISNGKENISTDKRNTTTPKIQKKVIDKKGKRKDLPNSLRRQLEKQQKDIIDMYKSIKAQKHKKLDQT